MGIMCSDVTASGKGVVTFDIGISKIGETMFRITWWNGTEWSKVYYKSFNAAHRTFDLIRRMG